MVVLHEFDVVPDRGRERLAVPALEEEAARIPEDGRLDHQDSGDRGRDRLHQNTRSFSTAMR